MTNRYDIVRESITFGDAVDTGGKENRIYPFIYTLVPLRDDTWESDKGTDTMTGIGPLVPAGGFVDVPLRLDPDFNFRLNRVKFSAYYNDNGTYYWKENVSPQLGTLVNPNTERGIDYLAYIRTQINFTSLSGRLLYGTGLIQGWENGDDKAPGIPLAFQGYDYGFGEIKTPYFNPREGIFMIRIKNTHATKALYVAGAFFGVKVRL